MASGWDQSNDLEQRACNVLETLIVAAVVTVALALGVVWVLPSVTPADCAPTVGAPGSPVPPPCIVMVEPGAETNGGG